MAITEVEERLGANRLLSLLRQEDLDPLLETATYQDLEAGTKLFCAGQPIESVYFLSEGIASIIAQLENGKSSSVAIIGREGFLVPAAVLGTDTVANRCEMITPGRGFRIEVGHFRSQAGRNPRVQAMMLGFAYTLIAQLMSTMLSQSSTGIDRRLARLILMIHDRSSSDDLALMHEEASTMLGVRRPSVTTAMHMLEGEGLIRNDRGFVGVRNRNGLEAFAEGSYGRAEAEYNRTIAPFF